MLKNRIWDAPILTQYIHRLSLPLAFICAAALVVAVPWAMDPIHRSMRVFSVPKFALINLFAALGIAALLINDALLNSLLHRDGFPKKMLWLLGLWVIWLGITTALAIYPARSWIGSYEWQLGMFTQLALVAMCGLTFLIVRRAHDGQKLLQIMIWGGVPILIYGVLQYLGLDPIEWTRWGDAGPVIATLGNENYFGAYLALLLPLTLSQAFLTPNRFARASYFALIGLQAFCLFVTRSYGALIAACIACGLVLWWRWNFVIWQAKTILVTLLLLSMVGTTIIAIYGDVVGEWAVEAAGRELRPFTWGSAYKAAMARPLLGWGLSSFDLTQDQYATPGFKQRLGRVDRVMDRVHNIWLELAVETGLPGLGLWLVMASAAGYTMLQSAHRQLEPEAKTLILGGVASLFGYIIYQTVNPSDVGTASIFWWLGGWTLGLSFPQRVAEEAGQTVQPTPQLENAKFVLQVMLLVTVFGFGYGIWQWVMN